MSKVIVPHAKFKQLADYLRELDDRHALDMLGSIKSDVVDMLDLIPYWRELSALSDNEVGQLGTVIVGKYDDAGEWCSGSGWHLYDDVWLVEDCSFYGATHWMPLPEPPNKAPEVGG